MILGKLTDEDINLKYWYKQPQTWSQLSYEGKYQKLQPPSKEEIVNLYSSHKQYYKTLVHQPQFQGILDALNFNRNEAGEIVSTTQSAAVTEAVNNFYKAINSIYSWAENTGSNKEEIVVYEKQLSQLLIELKKIQKDVDAGNIQLLKGDIARLDNFITTVSANLNTAKIQGSAVISRSIFGKAASLRSALGGAILETKMVKELQKYNLNGAKLVFNTGQMVDLRGKAIKPDAMIIPGGTELKNKKGQIIGTFTNNGTFEMADGVMEIRVDLDNIEPFLGISAKTARQPNFGQAVNINTFLDSALDGGDKYIQELIHIYQLGTALQESNAITSSVNMYQSYATAKMCQKVIGKHNAFIATRGAIVPTYQYIDQIIHSRDIRSMLRFSNRQIPARKRGMPLNTKFGITDIRGSMIKT